MYNNYIYIAVMALVSYTIRILPLTLIRKPIKNQFIQSFLYYVPYVSMQHRALFPAHSRLSSASQPHGSVQTCFRFRWHAVPWCL